MMKFIGDGEYKCSSCGNVQVSEGPCTWCNREKNISLVREVPESYCPRCGAQEEEGSGCPVCGGFQD